MESYQSQEVPGDFDAEMWVDNVINAFRSIHRCCLGGPRKRISLRGHEHTYNTPQATRSRGAPR